MGIVDLFSTDHRHCDALFGELDAAIDAGDLSAAAVSCDAFQKAMSRHFAAEEDELFPAFERATGVTSGTTLLMRQEHERMSAMMNHMAGAIAAGDVDAYHDEAEKLHALLEVHSVKEEHLVYVLCDERLIEEQAQLALRLSNALPA